MINLKTKYAFGGLVIAIMIIVSGYFYWKKPAPMALTFTPITSIVELNRALKIAAQQQHPVLLGVYAEWCSPCIALTQKTFPATKVIPQHNKFTRLKANVTANNAADIALMQHLQIIGFPSLLFWDPQGNPLPQATISGFINADDFSHYLQLPMFSPAPSSASQKTP